MLLKQSAYRKREKYDNKNDKDTEVPVKLAVI